MALSTIVAVPTGGRSATAVVPTRGRSGGTRGEGGAVESLNLAGGIGMGLAEGGHKSVGRVGKLWGGRRRFDVAKYLMYCSARARLKCSQ